MLIFDKATKLAAITGLGSLIYPGRDWSKRTGLGATQIVKSGRSQSLDSAATLLALRHRR